MKILNLFTKLGYKRQRNIVFILLLLAMAVAAFLFWRVGNIVARQNMAAISNNLALKSEQQVDAKIAEYQGEWERKLADKDQELERYKKMLADKGRTIAVVQTQVEYRDTGSLKTVVVYVDSTEADSMCYYPVYSASVENKWLKLNITASHDSVDYSLVTNDSLMVIFRESKEGFFKPRKTVAYVYSQSPYSGDQTQPMQYILVPKRKGLLCRVWRAIFNKK
jgi:hypothetical protein